MINLKFRCDSLRQCGEIGCYVHPLYPLYVYGCFCAPGSVLLPGTDECVLIEDCYRLQTTKIPGLATTPPDTICHADDCLRASSYILDVKG